MAYINYSRSERSLQAINNFEVPLSMINRTLITDFLNDNYFTEEELNHLKQARVCDWKSTAKRVGRSSWHHTSNYYNKTDHYSMQEIAEELLEYPVECFKPCKEDTEPIEYDFGYIVVQVWGGTRNHPKVIGEDVQTGIIKGDWLFYGANSRYKVNANKTLVVKRYPDYKTLVKNHPEYKGTKKRFNALIKAVIK